LEIFERETKVDLITKPAGGFLDIGQLTGNYR
jgi:hypothetical protein